MEKYDKVKAEVMAEFEKPRYAHDFPWADGPWGAISLAAQYALSSHWRDMDGDNDEDDEDNGDGMGPEDIGFPGIVEAVAVVGTYNALANRPSSEERATQWETVGSAMLSVFYAARTVESICIVDMLTNWTDVRKRFLARYDIEM